MKPIVLFGAAKIAEVVYRSMAADDRYEVVAFCVDQAFRSGETFCGLPLVDFESVEQQFPPEVHNMFVAVGYHELNALRAKKLEEARAKGYGIVSYVHPQAHLPADCEIGDNCFIMHNVCIHPCVKLGDNVFVWSGAMIGHHTTVGDHCWITSSANISGVVTLGDSCFVAVNATIGHGVDIGAACFLGANTLVTKNLAAETVVIEASSKPIRLSSRQFLRMSKFSDL